MTSYFASIVQTLNYSDRIGNTPATCLTQELPPNQAAQILLLGCGDARNILFTVYAEIDRASVGQTIQGTRN